MSVGVTCERCGLSEQGARAFVRRHFDPHPCNWCPPEVLAAVADEERQRDEGDDQ